MWRGCFAWFVLGSSWGKALDILVIKKKKKKKKDFIEVLKVILNSKLVW